MDEGTEAVRAYFNQDMTQPELVAAGGGTACVFSARCPAKESANEDAAAVIHAGPGSAVLLVADGLGGSPAGEQAARLAVESLFQEIRNAQAGDGLLRTAIINGFERANAAVQQLGVGAATTLAVMEVNDRVVRPYYVGDSIILIVGGRGKVKLQTVPHSPVGYAVEAGLIDEDEAMHHEHRHVVSNFVGTPEMHIAIGPPVQLAVRDTVLIASDGLFDNLYSDWIAQQIRQGHLQQAAGRLIDQSLHRMQNPIDGHPSKPDDLTFIAFRPK